MKGILFIILFFQAIAVYPQELLNLFKNEMPMDILIDAEKTKMMGLTLEGIELIHPDLYFFNILVMHKLYKSVFDTLTNIDRNGAAYMKNKFLLQRGLWLESQEEYVRNNETDTHFINIGRDYFYEEDVFDRKAFSDTTEKKLTYNQNMKDYFVVKSYLKDQNMVFDKTVNYKTIRNSYELGIIGQHKLQLKKLLAEEIDLSEAEKTFYDMIKYWYIYNERESEKNFPAEFVIEMIKYRYTHNESRNKPFKFVAGLYLGIVHDFTYTISIRETYFSKEHKYDIPFSQFYFGLRYSLFLSNKSTFLSNIGFEIGYAFAKYDIIHELEDVPAPSKDDPDGEIYDILLFDKNANSLSIKSTNALFLKAKIPILYYGNNLCLSFGTTLGFNTIKYHTNYEAQYRNATKESYSYWGVTKTRLIIHLSRDLEENGNIDYNFTEIYPYINLKYTLNDFEIGINAYSSRYILELNYSLF